MVNMRRGIGFGALLSVFAGLMITCTANKKPSRVETILANVAKDVAIPIEAKNRRNPVPANRDAIEQGASVYMQSCALCHGSDGHGETGIGRTMYPPAMDLTSPHVQHWSDGELFWIIENGIRLTGMPAWKSEISETDTWKLARFIRSLSQANVPANETPQKQAAAALKGADLVQYGKTLYRQEGCFMCHRLDGEGTRVGPDLTNEGNRARTSAWLIGHFKDPPAYSPSSLMPSFKNLTDEQLQALVAFLQSQKDLGK